MNFVILGPEVDEELEEEEMVSSDDEDGDDTHCCSTNSQVVNLSFVGYCHNVLACFGCLFEF